MHIDVIGVPVDLGAGRRGVDMGPSAIRYANLHDELIAIGHTVRDLGNIEVPIAEQIEQPGSGQKLRYVEVISKVARTAADFVEQSLREGHFPLVLGGDHSLSLGTIRGATRVKKLGVIWLDAHGDFNTGETSPSGNIHGMPLAALCGHGDPRLVALDDRTGCAVDPRNVALVGIRDLDELERELMEQAGVTVFAMDQIDCKGIYEIMRQAIAIASDGTEGIYLSLDLDGLDPLYAPGVGTPVQGGLTYREAHMACEMLAESGQLAAIDIVEVNPILDMANKTAVLAVDLIRSALGKRIWRHRMVSDGTE